MTGGEYLRGRDMAGPLTLDADVVVVGSGAGGAVAAAILAEAGQSVLVLEEGPRVEASTYAGWRPSESMRHMWRDGGMTAALPVGDSPIINVTMGRVVGGSSVLTGGVCFRTPDEIHEVWVKERGLTDLSAADLDPAFTAVESAVNVVEVPADMRSRGIQLYAEGAHRKGFEVGAIRRNTRDCVGAGQCNFGCPKGAKMSVDVAYLPRAVAAGARVLSDCRVVKVLRKGARAVGVEGRLLNHPKGNEHDGQRVTVRAKRVLLAAGSWHTPLVLKRSGLGRASKHIGRNLTLHPGFRLMARFDDPVRAWAGSLQSAYSDAFSDERITMVGLFVPPGVLAATMPGFGAVNAGHAAGIPNLAIFGGMIHDEGGGVIRRGPGREPLVTYRMSREDRAAMPRLVRVMAETFFASGARHVYLPILGHPPVTPDELAGIDLESIPAGRFECSSQHPLGSVRMGRSAAEGAIDTDGKLFGLEELFVVDGAGVPTSLGVNPQLTIMAMATRLAWRLRERPYAPA